ncbi:MAG: hypothetical protein ABFD25_09935 [Clostridiaceae bacterium]
MKKLVIDLLENDVLKKSESQVLFSDRIEEFLEALVFICNKLNTDVPVWTFREEKLLLKTNLVTIPISESGDTILRISTMCSLD